MANKPCKLNILIFIYTDYHLFGYFQLLIPKLLGSGHSVTLISGNAKVTEKYGVVHKHFKLKKAYYLTPFIHRMNLRIFRSISWILAWPWGFIQSRGYQLIIVPRTTKLLYLTLAMWKPTLKCDPGYGTEQKEFLAAKYRQERERKTNSPNNANSNEVHSPIKRFSCLDRMLSFGNAYGAPHHYKNTASRFYYTTLSKDLVEYFIEKGVPKSHVFVVGNPNNEAVSDGSNLSVDRCHYLRELSSDATASAAKQVFTVFVWLEQSDDGVENAEILLKTVNGLYPESVFLIKQHPAEVHGKAKLELKNRMIELSGQIVFLDASSANELNRNVIGISDAVFVQRHSSSVLALAVQLGVPAIRYDFFPTGRLDRWDFLAALDGLDILVTVEALQNRLRALEDETTKRSFQKRQAESLRKVDIQSVSPCTEIVRAIGTISCSWNQA